MTVLRTSTCVIALNAMVAAVSMTAQAANETLTLACKGKEYHSITGKGDQINIGVILDFQKKIVTGLSDAGLLTITDVTETTISFSRFEVGWNVNGTLDRVTGALVAASIKSDPNGKTILTLSYELQCRPTQRMF
jgi:hypothetical protein